MIGAATTKLVSRADSGPFYGDTKRHTGLELAFETRELRTICENEADAAQALGPNAAEALKHRLADLRAAASVCDLLVGRPQIHLSRADCMTLDLVDGFRIVFCANHPRIPAPAGRPEWVTVRRLKVVAIERDDV